MDVETRVWLVVGIYLFFLSVGFVARTCVWAVFYIAFKGKGTLKITKRGIK